MNSLRGFALMAAVWIAGLAAGCEKSPANPSVSSASGASGSGGAPSTVTTAVATSSSSSIKIPTKAQPKLQTIKLWLGPEELATELALSGLQQQTGMMFRTNMAENEAMLFVFPYPHQASFWMMNTYVPLSAAYIDPEGVILEIHKLEPLNTNAVEAATDRIQYVLETTQGWFDRHNVRTGMVVRSEYGPLKSTFVRR
jgi:uncharacterized membrane protein (UPF0127 family)